MTVPRFFPPTLTAVFLALALAPLNLRAEIVKTFTWEAGRTTSPETLDELRALQSKVKDITAKGMPSTVGLLIGSGAGSGVIVSPDGLVLTAGHVVGRPGRTLRFVLPDGRMVTGKTLGSDPKLDTGMARITDRPPASATWPGAKEGKWPVAEIGKGTALAKGQWVVALGHPGGPRRDRPPSVRVGRFDVKGDNFLRTDCTLVGGDSGGPLFDLNGRVVGIHSRIGLFLEYNMQVPTDLFQSEWDKLVRGEMIGKPSRAELGCEFDPETKQATVKRVEAGGPADKAGLKQGDVVTRFDEEPINAAADVALLLNGLTPGQTTPAVVRRGSEKVNLTITLGPLPKKDPSAAKDSAPKKEPAPGKDATPKKDPPPSKDATPKKEPAPDKEPAPKKDPPPAGKDATPKKEPPPAAKDATPRKEPPAGPAPAPQKEPPPAKEPPKKDNPPPKDK
jgi:serine protease Do